MNQIFLGGIVGFALWCIPYVLKKGRPGPLLLVFLPVMIGLFSLWAVAPDIPRLLGWHELYMQLAQDPRMDIFFWHFTIDLTETDSKWFGVGLWFMLVCSLLIPWRELHHREQTRNNA